MISCAGNLAPLARQSARRRSRRLGLSCRPRRTGRSRFLPFRPVRPPATTRRIASDGAMRRAERLGEHLPDLPADVDADFVEQA